MKLCRLRAGLTQTAMAEQLGVSRPLLSMVEKGDTGWMARSTAERVLKAYLALKPVDLSPVYEAKLRVLLGVRAKDAVEEAILCDPHAYRIARGELTIAQVADELRLSGSTVSRFESGRLSELTDAKVVLLAVHYATLAERLKGGRSDRATYAGSES